MASVNSVFFSDEDEFSDNFEENKATIQTAIVSSLSVTCPDEFLDTYVLLKSWKIKKEIIDVVIGAKLTIWHLRVIEDEDIARLFGTNFADCVEFKYYLKKWRNSGAKLVESTKISSQQTADPLGHHSSPGVSSVPVPTATTTNVPSSSSPPLTGVRKYSSKDEIENILKTNARGKGILQFYQTHQKLESQHQAWLVDIIADYYIQKYDTVSTKLMDRISDKIIELFPTEDKGVYYTRRSVTGNPKGKLHDKIKNKRRLYIIHGVIKKRKRNNPETNT